MSTRSRSEILSCDVAGTSSAPSEGLRTMVSSSSESQSPPLPTIADGSLPDSHGDDSYCALCRRCQMRKKLERRLAAKKESSAVVNTSRRELVSSSYFSRNNASQLLPAPPNGLEPPSSPCDEPGRAMNGFHANAHDDGMMNDVSCAIEPSLDELLEFIGEGTERHASQQRRQRKKRVPRNARKTTNTDSAEMDSTSSLTSVACAGDTALAHSALATNSVMVPAPIQTPPSTISSPSSLGHSPGLNANHFERSDHTSLSLSHHRKQGEVCCIRGDLKSPRENTSVTDHDFHSPLSDDMYHRESRDLDSLDEDSYLLSRDNPKEYEIHPHGQAQYGLGCCGDYDSIDMTPEEQEAIDQEVEEFRLCLEAVCTPSSGMQLPLVL